ncbi:MAG: DUF4197 domain-containing protein [Desulfobacterales bacterium]|nr:DUF4197 domain-containing protein [Desulfobacterales bacterium]
MLLFSRETKKYECTAVICTVVLLVWAVTTANAGNLFEKGLEIFSGSGEQNGEQSASTAGDLTSNEISEAFKQALAMGSEKVVQQLGQENGFNADPDVHIPLPEQFSVVQTTLEKAGMSYLADDLELKLNRAAEQAAPEAKALFLDAIADMTFADVKQIYNGPKDSATRYFRGKMADPLAEKMRPIIENKLSEAGAVQAYDKLMNKYQSMLFVPDVKANLTDYVTEKGMEGIFYYMADEEAAIRQNPARQTTDLLKRVFGSN